MQALVSIYQSLFNTGETLNSSFYPGLQLKASRKYHHQIGVHLKPERYNFMCGR
jgi:hypothetical protein